MIQKSADIVGKDFAEWIFLIALTGCLLVARLNAKAKEEKNFGTKNTTS